MVFFSSIFSQNISEISLKFTTQKGMLHWVLSSREKERVKWSKRQQHQTNIWWRHRPLLQFGGFEGGGTSPTEHDIILVVRSKSKKYVFIAIFMYSRIFARTYVWRTFIMKWISDKVLHAYLDHNFKYYRNIINGRKRVLFYTVLFYYWWTFMMLFWAIF